MIAMSVLIKFFDPVIFFCNNKVFSSIFAPQTQFLVCTLSRTHAPEIALFILTRIKQFSVLNERVDEVNYFDFDFLTECLCVC
jgi:hypothetical protein